MEKTGCHKECMTIVVPVYNREHLIRRCLDSIFAQSYRPLRVIVVDNDSSDSTYSEVGEWIRLHEDNDEGFSIMLLKDCRRGAAHARQTGLEHSDTQRIMFFDSDDVMRPTAVAAIMKAWDKNPGADAVAWPLIVHGKKGDITTHSISGNLLERHLVHAIFCTLGYAVKKSVLLNCGGWDGNFTCWDDLVTGTRLLLGNPRVVALKSPMAEVYPQEESITGVSFSEKVGKWELALDGIDDAISRSGRSDQQRLHNIVTYRRAILAAHYAKEGHPELANPLYQQALKEIPKEKRPLIRFAYHWTRLGMRGAFSIIGSFL